MNRKAQFFTLDLLLALIPLTLVLGMSANAISGIASQSQDYISTYSFHREPTDFMDIIVKTPGVPADWEQTLNVSQYGAARYENSLVEANYLNGRKIYNLNSSDNERILGTSNYNLSLYVEDPSLFADFANFSFPTFGVPVPDNPDEVVAVVRFVVVDNLLQISQDYPDGITNVSNLGGGTYCSASTTTIDLTEHERTNYVFWFFLTFDCNSNGPNCPSSVVIGVNNVQDYERCKQRNCNQIIEQADSPVSNNFNIYPENNGTTLMDKDLCGDFPDTDGNPDGKSEVEYWVNWTSSANKSMEFYMKVPVDMLVVGTQELYIKISGVKTVLSGWVANAPQEIERADLDTYFADKDKFKDQKCKLVLRMWR